MPIPGDVERQQEREAAEWLLYREHNADLRRQLQAAVELLGERAGLGMVEVNRILADRVERNRRTEQP